MIVTYSGLNFKTNLNMNARSFPLPVLIFFAGLLLTNCTKQEPVASFSVDRAVISEGESVQFTDQSLNDPTSWEWTFSGGTPASSSSQNPSVTYDNSGKYQVSLTVSNGDGSDAVIRKNCITVNLPPPVADFSADKNSITQGETVHFTDLSSNAPTEWLWIFEGGSPPTSSVQNPSVMYASQGTYTVSLVAGNASGYNSMEKIGYITVTGSAANTDITFYNSTHTAIDIEINGIQKVIPVGGNVTYYDLEGTSASLYAETSGETSQGSQIGMKLVWDGTIVFTGPQMAQTLDIGADYYFLYMQNNGTRSLGPLEIGIWDFTWDYYTVQSTENIIVPNDNVNYPVGYYESFVATGTNWIQIRAYYQDAPEWYTYWEQETNFILPDTINQYISLYNEFKKKSADSGWKDASGDVPQRLRQGMKEGIRITPLYPDHARKPEDQ